MLGDPPNGDAFLEFTDRVRQTLASSGLPGPLEAALGQCLRRRWNFNLPQSYSTCCADLISAAAKGADDLHAALVRHRISEKWIWCHPPFKWDRRT